MLLQWSCWPYCASQCLHMVTLVLLQSFPDLLYLGECQHFVAGCLAYHGPNAPFARGVSNSESHLLLSHCLHTISSLTSVKLFIC